MNMYEVGRMLELEEKGRQQRLITYNKAVKLVYEENKKYIDHVLGMEDFGMSYWEVEINWEKLFILMHELKEGVK